MPEKKIEDVVYEDGLDLQFVADQVAAADALQTFLIDCIRTAENFRHLQEKLTNGLTAVAITKAVNVDDFLNNQTEGFVVKYKQYGVVDYFRDDDGLPAIFKTPADALHAIPPDGELIRSIDLAEEAARRAN